MTDDILEATHECPECDYDTRYADELREHMGKTHNLGRDEWATIVFGPSEAAVQYARENDEIRIEACAICGNEFELLESPSQGIRAWGKPLPETDPRGDYCCDECYPPSRPSE